MTITETIASKKLCYYLSDIFSLCIQPTKYINTIIDLGTNIGNNNINEVPFLYNIPIKVAVEVDKKYIQQDTRHNWLHINQDILEFMKIVQKSQSVITLLDVIEHLDKKDALELIDSINKKCILSIIFTPEGFDEQQNSHTDLLENHPWEKHISGWTADEFEKLGYHVLILKNFHNNEHSNTNALLAYKIN